MYTDIFTQILDSIWWQLSEQWAENDMFLLECFQQLYGMWKKCYTRGKFFEGNLGKKSVHTLPDSGHFLALSHKNNCMKEIDVTDRRSCASSEHDDEWCGYN